MKEGGQLTGSGSSSRLLEELSGPDPWDRSGSDREADNVAHDAEDGNVGDPGADVKAFQSNSEENTARFLLI